MLVAAIVAHLDDRHRGEVLREGFHVVLAGPPNVGKSSLLNALARRDVAIVSEEAGTTRDVIEVRLDLDGLPVVVSDTAGIRQEPAGKLEQEGIRRTLGRARSADLVVWLVDAANPQAGIPAELSGQADRVLVAANKMDLLDPTVLQVLPGGAIGISALTGFGIDVLTRRLAALARARIGDSEAPALTQARHRQALERSLAPLRSFLGGDLAEVELRAEDLRRAAQALGRLTGAVGVEEVLDQIFSRFCIGK
jgi:tRNA modification GTPase